MVKDMDNHNKKVAVWKKVYKTLFIDHEISWAIKKCIFLAKIIIKKMIPKQIYDRLYTRRFYLMFHRELSKKKYFVAASKYGLSNRLKAVISAMRYADVYNGKAILYWPINDECGCKFSDLFENKLDEIDDQEMHRITNDEEFYVVSPSVLATLPKDKIPYKFGISCHLIFPFYNIDCEYNRIPLRARRNILPYINSLMPKKFIIERVERFSDTFDSKVLGVSLRTWSDAIRYRYDRREHFFDFDKIYSIIDKIKPEKIFVTSDSEEAFMKIYERYQDKILYVPKRTFWGDRDSKEGIQDAFVDQLILSKCNMLIAGYLSTYIELAWWFGDCKAKVFVLKKHAI